MSEDYKSLWDLDPDTTYLNHGSFGPSPIEVRAVREQWSARLERQPMRFFCQDLDQLLTESATALGDFLATKVQRLALVDNATIAMNIVAASTQLEPDDEVLLTDHEYGAVRNIWNQRCRETGARTVVARLPYPLDDDDILAAMEASITSRTRMIVVSHITSATAAILPASQICRLARQHKIQTVVDGPHALAMLDVRPEDIGCDYYCGSCHKWLCAPFGSGFLWAHPRHHSQIRCPMTSWGGSITGQAPSWQDSINWMGTRDPAALLSIPAAIDFMQRIGLDTFRQHGHELVQYGREQLLAIDGTGPLCTPELSPNATMCCVELPQPSGWQPGYHGHPDALQLDLRDNHGIEIPVGSWNGKRFLRISAHLYNSRPQIDKLLTAVTNSPHLR